MNSRDRNSLIMWYSDVTIFRVLQITVTKILEIAKELFHVLSILCILHCCLDSYIAIFNQLQYSAIHLPLTEVNTDPYGCSAPPGFSSEWEEGEDFTLKVFTFHTKSAFGDSSPTCPESECFPAAPTPPPSTGGGLFGQAGKVINSEKSISTRAGQHQGCLATLL